MIRNDLAPGRFDKALNQTEVELETYRHDDDIVVPMEQFSSATTRPVSRQEALKMIAETHNALLARYQQ